MLLQVTSLMLLHGTTVERRVFQLAPRLSYLFSLIEESLLGTKLGSPSNER